MRAKKAFHVRTIKIVTSLIEVWVFFLPLAPKVFLEFFNTLLVIPISEINKD